LLHSLWHYRMNHESAKVRNTKYNKPFVFSYSRAFVMDF
jgi:hypothetical protein